MKKHFTIFLLFVCLLILNGCGEKEKTNLDNNISDGKEDVSDKTDVKNNSDTNHNSTMGDTNVSSEFNELGLTKGVLPNNFPKDIPTPKNSKVLGYLESFEGMNVTFETQEKVNDIFAFYKEEMEKSGYVLVNRDENMISEKGGIIKWEKGDSKVELTISSTGNPEVNSVVITYK